jgi:flagellar hook-associated protein 2
MGIGLSGMISGLDTDSIVEAMVGGQTAKKTKVDNKITLNKWTTNAWSDLNKKIYSFYTEFASKLRLKSA